MEKNIKPQYKTEYIQNILFYTNLKYWYESHPSKGTFSYFIIKRMEHIQDKGHRCISGFMEY